MAALQSLIRAPTSEVQGGGRHAARSEEATKKTAATANPASG